MTKRIFQSILLVTLASLAVSLAFFTAILFPYFENRLADELAQELAYLAPGAVSGGSEYLRQAGAGGNRLTLIAPAGSVLFDTTADPAGLENPADRQEVQQALAGQAGRSVRYSKTLDKKTINCALLLSDGNVLRVSSTQYTGFALLLSLIQPMLMVLALTAVLAGLYAYRLSRRLTRPLNEIDLEHPQPSQAPYEELAPLLRRLAHQKRQIKSQMQELQRQQQQFEAITENMQEGFLVLDAAGSVLSHNSGAARLLNLSSPPTGKNALELGLCEEFSQPVRQALSGDHVESLIPLHGRQCQLFANPVFQGDQLAGTVLVLVDVTEQQQREALRREFSANVSHELKTPLTSISGIAEIMRGGLVPPGDVPHFAGKIYDESQRLIQLVQDILRLSQLDEDSVLEKPQPVDLMACLRRAADQLAPAARAQNVQLAVRGGSVWIQGVAAILDEMVFNLCENAIKYNRPGGSVELWAGADVRGPVLTVSDTGIGIPPEHHARVFERFYRVDKSHSKEIGGTGLGLSIVKHGAAFHHAQVELESTPGVGTTVRLLFPASAQVPAEPL